MRNLNVQKSVLRNICKEINISQFTTQHRYFVINSEVFHDSSHYNVTYIDVVYIERA